MTTPSLLLLALVLEAPILVPLYFYLRHLGKRALARHTHPSHTDITHPPKEAQ